MPIPAALLTLAGIAAPMAGQLIAGSMGNTAANRDRRLKKRELEDQEKNDEFSRLIKLSQAGRTAQGDMAAGRRLLSLRNTGSM